MVSINEMGKMIKAGNVKGLSQIFQKAGDWDTRETVVVAIRNMVWDKQAFDNAEMIDALTSIEQVCRAETGGGTYRTNCLDVASDLLRELQASGLR